MYVPSQELKNNYLVSTITGASTCLSFSVKMLKAEVQMAEEKVAEKNRAE
jgi:ArsR family metal-binding transcriptional regulator